MSHSILIALLLYYAYGLGWLIHGHVTGWLMWDGHPLPVAIWTVVAAAVWPWLVRKILRDLANGKSVTSLIS